MEILHQQVVLHFLRQILVEVEIFFTIQSQVVIIFPSEVEVIHNSLLEIKVDVLISVEAVNHAEKLVEIFALIELVVKFVERLQNFTKVVQNDEILKI